MSETVYNLYEAKTFLSKLVDRVAAGEEIVIAKAGTPMAKLVPIPGESAGRRPGGWQGRIFIAEDFDEALPDDVLAAFESDS